MKDFHMWVAEMEGAIPDASHFVKPDFEVNQIASGTLTNEGTKMIGLTPGQKALKVADDAYRRINRLWFVAFEAEYSYTINPDLRVLTYVKNVLSTNLDPIAFEVNANVLELIIKENSL